MSSISDLIIDAKKSVELRRKKAQEWNDQKNAIFEKGKKSKKALLRDFEKAWPVKAVEINQILVEWKKELKKHGINCIITEPSGIEEMDIYCDMPSLYYLLYSLCSFKSTNYSLGPVWKVVLEDKSQKHLHEFKFQLTWVKGRRWEIVNDKHYLPTLDLENLLKESVKYAFMSMGNKKGV